MFRKSTPPRTAEITQPRDGTEGFTPLMLSLRLVSLLHCLLGTAATASAIVYWLWQRSNSPYTFLLVFGAGLVGTLVLNDITLAWCELMNDFFMSVIIHWPRIMSVFDFTAEGKNEIYSDTNPEKYNGRLSQTFIRAPALSQGSIAGTTTAIILLSVLKRSWLPPIWQCFLHVEKYVVIALLAYMILFALRESLKQ